MATKVFIVLSLFYCVWAQIAARQADEFVKSSCINTHFDYPAYKPHLDTLYQFLTKSGIRSVRDAPSDNKVSDLGISTAWTIEVNNGMTTSSLQTKVNTLNSRVKAGFKVVAVLGPNEPNNIWIKDSVTYNGQGAPDESKNSVGGVVAFQTDLYNMVKASSDMKNIPVWGPPWSSGQWVPNVTFVGNFDYGDFHPYPAGNCHSIYYSYAGIDNYYCVTNSPATQLTKGYSTNNFLLTEYEYYFGGKTLMASETGYHTSNGDNNVPIDVHTIYMPRVWLENFRIGFPISCSYELYDQGTDLSDKEQNFGVIFNNLTAKPAFNIMSFMFNFLSDKGADFTPDSVTASLLVTPVGGFTRTELVRILLFQKRSKTDFYIIIWHEVAHYNVWTGATVNIPDMPTTVTLSKGMSSATLHTFDLRGAVTNSTISLSANGTKFSVTATPMMKIIHLTSSTSSPPTPSPPTPSPPSTSNKIVSNGILAQNDRLWDPTNRYFLTLQDDGNLVVYRLNNATSTTPIWASNSINASADSYTLYIQSDGNVVVNAQFGSQSRPLWDTKTAGKGTGPYTLSIDSSGILTLSDSKETLLWSSSTLSAGTTLTTATSAAGTTSTSGKTPSLTSSTSTSGNTTKSQVDQSVSGNERIYIPFMCLLFAIALL